MRLRQSLVHTTGPLVLLLLLYQEEGGGGQPGHVLALHLVSRPPPVCQSCNAACVKLCIVDLFSPSGLLFRQRNFAILTFGCPFVLCLSLIEQKKDKIKSINTIIILCPQKASSCSKSILCHESRSKPPESCSSHYLFMDGTIFNSYFRILRMFFKIWIYVTFFNRIPTSNRGIWVPLRIYFLCW